MRLKLLLGTTMIAASVGLAACSSGGSQELLGGSPAVAPAAQHAAASGGHTRHLIAVGVRRDADFPLRTLPV